MSRRTLVTGGPDPAPARTAAKLIERGSITPEQVAEQVAEQVVTAVDRHRFLVHPHREGRTAVRLARLPRLVDGVVAKSWRRTEAMLDAQDRQEQHQ